MTEQVNVPKLRFEEFSENWQAIELGELMNFKNGINASKEQYGRGVKFINVLDIIENDYITYDRIVGSVDVEDKEFEKNIVEYGDILFQRSSETREEVGQANVYLDKKKVATFGGFVIRGKKVGNFDSVCMNYLLKTDKARKEVTTKSGGSTRYNVGQATLSAVNIDLPPCIPEQQKIASFLSKVDEKIALLSEKKDKLTEYKKGVMQQLFDGKFQEQDGKLVFVPPTLRFKADDGSEFPDWVEKTLGDVSEPPSYGLNSAATKYDGVNKYIRITDIDEDDRSFSPSPLTSPEEVNDAYLLEEGDIVFARTGASVGKSYLYNKDDGRLMFAGFLIKFSVSKANPKFISYQMTTSQYEHWVKVMSVRSGQPGINAQEYSTYSLNIPCTEEQEQIANFLSALDHKIDLLSSELEKAKEWKKGLLQQMFV
ncbi:restriction endonuclease subunit S [Vibrio parahaemolyticus]|uniref:restriction endonuclease subunit S n=1 Tax=Vibrio parahaemolyticus TaxID=670 RepID=UPI002360750C|nr:restriction endonuclease subunit S [Vibrio parahaemolyticus]HCH5917977.1 restriction endonuclease subunit S [Vibrio parahaemolyticus]